MANKLYSSYARGHNERHQYLHHYYNGTRLSATLRYKATNKYEYSQINVCN